MNILFIPSLPISHELTDKDGFLDIANRDKWMSSLLIRRGYPTRLWAAGESSYEDEWQYDDLPAVPVRIFKTDASNPDPLREVSTALNKAVAESDADMVILKGLDGGVGLQLAKHVLVPKGIPFAWIIDGTWYHPLLARAFAVLYETEWQRGQLTSRGIRFWRKVIDDKKMIPLPKSVDTRHFAPDPLVTKECDVIGMEQVLTHSPKMDSLIALSRHLKVGVIGGGSELYNFRKRYPEIDWYGAVPYSDLPAMINRGRIFFHSGLRHDHPRSIVEAAACGVPPVAFREVTDERVLPESVGWRITQKKFVDELVALAADREKLQKVSHTARSHAEKHWHHTSSLPAIRELINRMIETKKNTG
ncbi:glycosyltransferase [Balneolales bacterium ANBcel1]|nr:glycosyltransferase [Balneolales bacterium ANBcel1]